MRQEVKTSTHLVHESMNYEIFNVCGCTKTVEQLTQEYGGVEQPDDRHGYRQTFNLPSSRMSTDPTTPIYKHLQQFITVTAGRVRRRLVL